jgi:chromate reductase, NAD(P)H dehydrogenase (quinone)
MKILAISGSLRKDSFNTGLLRAAIEEAPDGMDISIASIAGIQIYNGDDESGDGFPANVLQLADDIRGADGVLIATPEYNFSIPGGLKNAIDWISRVENQPFANKPLAIMGAAGGPLGTGRVQYDLRKVLGSLSADIVQKPEIFVAAAHTKFEDGRFTDQTGRGFIGKLLEALAVKIS